MKKKWAANNEKMKSESTKSKTTNRETSIVKQNASFSMNDK